jgi:CHAT domain-containing protein
LGSLLGGKSFRLAVLSACSTGAGNFADNFSVLAETLVRRGFPAVVANQLPLPDETAAIFAEGLYGELLKSGDIDKAVSEGRVALFTQLNNGASAVLEWGIPTLHRRLGTSQLFQPS